MEIQSITLNVPVSEMHNFMDIVSKYKWEIVSKSDFNPISTAESQPGAEVVDRLTVAFPTSVTDGDRKDAKGDHANPYSTPFTKEELDTRFAQVEDDIRNGRTYPIDDLLDEYEQKFKELCS